jgi:hypothetical protein
MKEAADIRVQSKDPQQKSKEDEKKNGAKQGPADDAVKEEELVRLPRVVGVAK